MLLKIAKNLANPKTHGKIILRPVSDVFSLPEVRFVPKNVLGSGTKLLSSFVHNCI
jgi:hypothetical protein